MANEYDEATMQKMFDVIRSKELKNDKTGQYSDKEMVELIKKIVVKQVKEDMGVEQHMKFKEIRLYNFMRYQGENSLLFSTDPEKNVTVILGDNTFGKTTIAQAFRWGL